MVEGRNSVARRKKQKKREFNKDRKSNREHEQTKKE